MTPVVKDFSRAYQYLNKYKYPAVLLQHEFCILHITFSSLSTTMTIEYLTLQPSGDKMPLIGFGCAKIDIDATPQVIYNAIKVGYRLFDGGANYYNEKQVGEGIRMAIKDGLVTRKEIFVISKLWCTFHGNVREGLQKSLDDLGLDYVDMYLIHCKY